MIYNNGDQVVEVGGSTMTFGTGIPIAADTWGPAIDAGPNMIVYGIVTSGTADVRVLEMSDIDSGA